MRLLRHFGTKPKKDKEKLQATMQIWDLNVKDYEAMEKILPEDSRVYRMYAQFLGEESLSFSMAG